MLLYFYLKKLGNERVLMHAALLTDEVYLDKTSMVCTEFFKFELIDNLNLNLNSNRTSYIPLMYYVEMDVLKLINIYMQMRKIIYSRESTASGNHQELVL